MWLTIKRRSGKIAAAGLVALLFGCLAGHAADVSTFEETIVPLTNRGFDEGLRGWGVPSAGVSLETVALEEGSSKVARLQPGKALQRTLTVDRGRIEQQGRRCLVQVRARVTGNSSLQLRVRLGGTHRDVILRQPDAWQTVTAVVDTPPYLPGATTAELSIEIGFSGDGHADIDEVRVATLHPYHLLMRVTVLPPKAGTFGSSVQVIRRHRDTGHADSVRHRYSSAIAPAAQPIAAGTPSAWIDLQRHLFGYGQATVTMTFVDAATGERATDLRLKVDLAVPVSAPAVKGTQTDALEALMDDADDGFRLEDEKAPEPRVVRTLEVTADRGLVTLFLPENQTAPARFVASIASIQDDIAERQIWIDELLPADGELPLRIPIAANISALDGLLNTSELLEEARILRRIGISAVARSASVAQEAIDRVRAPAMEGQSFQDRLYWRISHDDIMSPYDGDRLLTLLTEQYRDAAAALRQSGNAEHVRLIELMDEPPDYALTEVDVPAFRDFLRELKVTPAEVGAESWEMVSPWHGASSAALDEAEEEPDLPEAPTGPGEIDNPDLRLEEPAPAATAAAPPDPSTLPNRRLQYYTRRFAARRTADIFRLATGVVEAELPEVYTTVNFRSGVRRVLLSETADWFEFGRRRAVTMLWNEDWLNTYGWRRNGIQLVSYYTELMHAAARPHDLPHGCFVIVMGHTLEKAYSALAHGATRISFWRYGPAYANYLPYSWSNSREAVHDIGTFSRDVAAIEDILVESQRYPARVALLYAKADPVWGYSQNENRMVAFALLHDQIPWELVTEAEVEEDALLERFKILYVTDYCVRRATQVKLAAWVRQGGELWLSGSAASRDEFNEPTTILQEALGISASTLAAAEAPVTGRAGEGRFCVMTSRPGELYEVPVRERFNRTHGKGRLQGGWPESVRQQITAFAGETAAVRPVRTSLAGVEAMLYRHPTTDLLFLINYTGEEGPLDVRISLPGRPDVTGAVSLRQGELLVEQGRESVQFTLSLERADTVLLHHKGDQELLPKR